MKTVHRFNTIYGDYVSPHFVDELNCVAEDAVAMSKLHRDDLLKLEGGLHHQDLPATIKAIDFWCSIITKCKEFRDAQR